MGGDGVVGVAVGGRILLVHHTNLGSIGKHTGFLQILTSFLGFCGAYSNSFKKNYGSMWI